MDRFSIFCTVLKIYLVIFITIFGSNAFPEMLIKPVEFNTQTSATLLGNAPTYDQNHQPNSCCSSVISDISPTKDSSQKQEEGKPRSLQEIEYISILADTT